MEKEQLSQGKNQKTKQQPNADMAGIQQSPAVLGGVHPKVQGQGQTACQQGKEGEKMNADHFFHGKDLRVRRISESEKVYREKKFIIGMSPLTFDETLSDEFNDEKVVVQGILDCAFEEDGEIVIVDYKTDKVSSPETLRERYSGQLRIYEQAVRECLGKNVKETLLYSFSLETTVKI